MSSGISHNPSAAAAAVDVQGNAKESSLSNGMAMKIAMTALAVLLGAGAVAGIVLFVPVIAAAMPTYGAALAIVGGGMLGLAIALAIQASRKKVADDSMISEQETPLGPKELIKAKIDELEAQQEPAPVIQTASTGNPNTSVPKLIKKIKETQKAYDVARAAESPDAEAIKATLDGEKRKLEKALKSNK